ncbi:MAG: hypothetical protein EOP87_26415 [Verrucomicrobiaceae bacterium]|nr:MAG: hypothetical protein EOP87_26415 [Verrucomicrobiaceae bacterium]
MGETTGTGRLIYTGTGEESARGFLLRSTDTTGSVGGGLIEQAGAGTLKFTGNVGSSSTTAAKTLTLQGSTEGVGELSGVISNSDAGLTNLTKAGTGTWTVSGVNTYTGTTTVNGGTLVAGGTTTGSGVNSSTAIVVNAAATFALGRDNVIGDLSSLTLNGGTLDTRGNDDTLGNLSLTNLNTLALGDGSTTLTFSGLTAGVGSMLRITGWTGLETGGGTDQVIFTGGLTETQLASIKFVDPNGISGTFDAAVLGNGEIYAVVPESSVAGFILLSACGFAFRRRDRRRGA